MKFIRFAQWRIERTGEGVLGFVTNHGYLDNPTFRGMRQSLMTTFDEIRLLDLHGNAKKRERAPDGGPDENVFDIQQGVAIAIFVKRMDGDDSPARVFHTDLWGERESELGGGKYGWLAANDIASTDWAELSPKSPHYLFVPRDEALIDEYEAAWSVPAIFSPNGDPRSGYRHDSRSVRDLLDCGRGRVQGGAPAGHQVRGSRLARSGASVRKTSGGTSAQRRNWRTGTGANTIEAIQYRPFDVRATVFDRNVAVHRRERVMQHMLTGSNLAFSTTRATEIAGGWEHVFASRHLAQHHTVSNKEVNYLFPLYVYPLGEDAMQLGVAKRTPNLSPTFTGALADSTGLRFTPDGPGDLEATFGPEDVFHYIYAVLHSPEYRRRYADFLKSDFPRVPLPGDTALFAELATGLGARLATLHLMEADGADAPAFTVAGDNRVERVRYVEPSGDAPGRVWINGEQHFEGVSPETWALTIGGYRPAEKWLKDRKGRTLSFDEIDWYRRVCAALAETPRVMERIDEAIAARGGWPLGA